MSIKNIVAATGTGILGLLTGYVSTAFDTVIPEPCKMICSNSNTLCGQTNCSAYQVHGHWTGKTESPKGSFPVEISINIQSGNMVSGTHNIFPFEAVAVQPGGRFTYTFSDSKRDRHYSADFIPGTDERASIKFSVRDDSNMGNGRFYKGNGTVERDK